METVDITFRVDEKTGKAFEKATPEEQEQIRQRTQQFIQRMLMSRDEAAAAFRHITARTGTYATSQGWTDEMNDAL